MNPGDVAPMVISLALIITTGGVILLRPISKRLAELLHAMTQERLSPRADADLGQLHEQLSIVNGRLALLEERQNFTDALLDPDNRPGQLPSRPAGPRVERPSETAAP